MQSRFNDGSVIAAGTAVKDATKKHVGEKGYCVTEFSIVAGKNKDTTTIFVNCKAWFDLGEYAGNIKKGDYVCVIGKIEEREYNGKIYKNLVADWLNFVKKDGQPVYNPDDFEAPKDDAELPF